MKNKGFWRTLAASIVLYALARHQAQAWRGYAAVGGELLILFIPVAYRALQRVWEDFKGMWTEVHNGDTVKPV